MYDAYYEHIDRNGLSIFKVFLVDQSFVTFNCVYCGYMSVKNNSGRMTLLSGYPATSCKNVWKLRNEEMARAYLTYVLLNEQSGEGAYKIKLEGHFKSQIKPFVDFIKSVIPSSDRTYDPTTYEWHYHEKYDDIIRKALKGTSFHITDVVTKEQYAELKRKQEEFAQARPISTEMIPVEIDLKAFEALLLTAGVKWNNPPSEWNKEVASKAYKKAIIYYHPDLHPEREEQSYQLNSIWRRLQESYYLK